MLRYSFMVRSVTRPFHLPLRMQQWENQGKSNGFSESYQEFDDLKGFKLHTCFLSLDPKSQIVRSVWKDLSFDPENHSFRRSPDLFYRFRWFRSGGSKAESNLTNVQLITINIYIFICIYNIIYVYIYIHTKGLSLSFPQLLLKSAMRCWDLHSQDGSQNRTYHRLSAESAFTCIKRVMRLSDQNTRVSRYLVAKV